VSIEIRAGVSEDKESFAKKRRLMECLWHVRRDVTGWDFRVFIDETMV
jgi:hypothetical protein